MNQKSNPKPDNIVRKAFDKVTSPVQAFAQLEASSGIVLLSMALLALFAANVGTFSDSYFNFINLPISIAVGAFSLDKSLLLLVNDGLMAIFFYLVGLEIKREILAGELSSPKKASFSIFAAIGGMAIPALVYIAFNPSSPTMSGWGIPMATDIAFALGILALIGKRVPIALKVFLLALAIVDDLGAISIIALFYTSEISANFLGFAGITLLLLGLLNFAGFRNLAIGIFLGFVTWFCFLKSGVHATLAGVLLAFLTPARAVSGDNTERKSDPLLLDNYIHALHPWVAFLIMPIFAFFNAGVKLTGVDIASVIMSPVPLGISLGLVVGKPVGVFLFTYLPVKLGWARLPEGVSWLQVIAVGFIAGIGFTMSLFISSLAFSDPELGMQTKVGILFGSAVAALVGSAILYISLQLKQEPAKS